MSSDEFASSPFRFTHEELKLRLLEIETNIANVDSAPRTNTLTSCHLSDGAQRERVNDLVYGEAVIDNDAIVGGYERRCVPLGSRECQTTQRQGHQFGRCAQSIALDSGRRVLFAMGLCGGRDGMVCKRVIKCVICRRSH